MMKLDGALFPWRFRLMVGLLLLLVGGIVAQIVYLQVINRDFLIGQGDARSMRHIPIPAHRGLITDRNGEPLAVSTPVTTLWANPKEMQLAKDKWPALARALGQDPKALAERLEAQASKEFIYLVRGLTPEQGASVLDLKTPGVYGIEEFRRFYPAGDVTAHMVGFTDLDDHGREGVELAYDEWLAGVPGKRQVIKDRRGRLIKDVQVTKNAKAGKTLALSIDLRLQYLASRELRNAITENEAKAGSMVIMDVKTGEVLAMVSQPSFDPNLFVTGISFKAYAELRDSIDRPLFNRVLRGLYPPGSTIKPAVAIAGLDAGVVTASSRVFDPGYYMLPNYDHKYRNWNRTGDGFVDLDTAIMRSNDTYFYDLAHKLGIDRLSAYMNKFGIGQKVSLDMFEESPGLMPSREWKRATRKQAWFPGETLILGIGQGYMQSTPLQLAQATALVANKGIWNRPHLAKSLDGVKPVDDNPMPNIVLRDPSDWNKVNHGMQQVMHGARGTARKAAIGAQYRIAGKSGTAQVVAIKQGEKYDRSKVQERHRDHALFVGFAPADDPKIVVSVMVENGESGSGVAAPVVRQVMDAWLLDKDGHLKAEYASPITAEATARDE